MNFIRNIIPPLLGFFGVILFVLGIRRNRDDREIDRIWSDLKGEKPTGEIFAPDMVEDLPAPVQRYFMHAIKPGTPLVSSVQLDMSGEIKLGSSWRPFSAREVLTPLHGFMWRPTLDMGAISFQGADHYVDGNGRVLMRAAMVPVVDASGPDISRSALGRMIMEMIWLPASLLPQRGVEWEAADDEHISATVTMDGETITLNITIDAAGQVQEVKSRRWKADDIAYVPFGVVFEQDQTFDGYTIPSQGHAGWWYGTDMHEEGQFFRCTINGARFG